MAARKRTLMDSIFCTFLKSLHQVRNRNKSRCQMSNPQDFLEFLGSLDVIRIRPSLDCYCKVNSVQEACAKCFVVHILKFENLQTT